MKEGALLSLSIFVALGCGDQGSQERANAGGASAGAPSSSAGGAAPTGSAGEGGSVSNGRGAGSGAGDRSGDGGPQSVGDSSASTGSDMGTPVTAKGALQTVFVIVMENQNWSQIKNSSSALYINSLLAMGAHAENYKGGDNGNLHPSEPNYIWLEAGTNANLPNGGSAVTFTKDDDPGPSNQSTTAQHLVTQLNAAGLSWKSYQEDITAGTCPTSSSGKYAAKHNPMVYFTDVTMSSSYCSAHIRPFTDLAQDLIAQQQARYNFVTPNLCHDMHDFLFCDSLNQIQNGDDWLKLNLKPILDSQSYLQNGAVFLTWDENAASSGCGASCPPVGMIVLSPLAKKNYTSTIAYDHSSLVKTLQKIFGLTPLLGHAADPTVSDLSDLFLPGALP
jgi:phosphatidylinositol-3-phosphatase